MKDDPSAWSLLDSSPWRRSLTSAGDVWIICRVDDVINVSEAAVIGQPDERTGQAIWSDIRHDELVAEVRRGPRAGRRDHAARDPAVARGGCRGGVIDRRCESRPLSRVGADLDVASSLSNQWSAPSRARAGFSSPTKTPAIPAQGGQ